MKKRSRKKIWAVAAALALVVAALPFVGIGGDATDVYGSYGIIDDTEVTFASETTCTHGTPASFWSMDGTHHWKMCTTDGCTAVYDHAAHSYTDGVCACGLHAADGDQPFDHAAAGWTGISGYQSSLGAGKYYLTGDVMTTGTSLNLSASGGEIWLCLNGHDIIGCTGFPILTITSGTIHLCDCAGGGAAYFESPATMSPVQFGVNATLNMYGGTLGSDTVQSGIGVDFFNSNCTFNMYGGTITNCTDSFWSTGGGGVRVYSNGAFNMLGGEIKNCTAINGGGVYVDSDGTFNMYGGVISDCDATGTSYTDGGGGVYNAGAFTMEGGTITDCDATNGGGVYVDGNVAFNMLGGSISSCNATEGGGVYVKYDGEFTMTGGVIGGADASDGNYAAGTSGMDSYTYISFSYGGGGVSNYGNFTMSDDAKILNNRTDTVGGGVWTAPYAEFTFDYGTNEYSPVSHNSTFTMNGGTIAGNGAYYYGGGVYVGAHAAANPYDTSVLLRLQGKFVMNGGDISSNTATVYGGGGVCVESGIFEMNTGATISGNTANDSYMAGGGVYLSDLTAFNAGAATSSMCTMDGGTITGNHAPNGNGGGMCVQSGSLTMENGAAITNNDAANSGGVFLDAYGKLTMSDGTAITGNTATGGAGGVSNSNGGQFYLQGDIDISGNKQGTAGSGFENSNVFAGSGGIRITGELTYDTPIGVSYYDYYQVGQDSHFAMEADAYNDPLYGHPTYGWNKFMSEKEVDDYFVSEYEGFYIRNWTNTDNVYDVGLHFENKKTITFDGGVDATVAPASVERFVGETIETAPSASKEGSALTGWSYEYFDYGLWATTTGTWVFGTGVGATKVTEDTTLTAQWTTSQFTVTFNANGGTGTMEPQGFLYDEPLHLIKNTFTNGGRGFLGWATSADGEVEYADGAEFEVSAEDGTGTTLYAVWEDMMDVTFHSGHFVDFGLPASVTIEGPENKTIMEVLEGNAEYSTILTAMQNVSRVGYTFGGWYVGGMPLDETLDFDETYIKSYENIFSRWFCTVDFDSNGGSNVEPITNALEGYPIQRPADPTMDGKVFGGWYRDDALTQEWNFDSDFIDGPMTLKAKWTDPVVDPFDDPDGDNVPNAVDPDDDGDGVPDWVDTYEPTNDPEADDDGDGIKNKDDPDHPSFWDTDGDGDYDGDDKDSYWQPDEDNGGRYPGETDKKPVTGHPEDTDGDGNPDCVDPAPKNPSGNAEPDRDGDGTPDKDDEKYDPLGDPDNDGIPNASDDDNDGDGIRDWYDPHVDSDNDGVADWKDTDDDGTGETPDTTDDDTDGDGILNEDDPDHPDFWEQSGDGSGTDAGDPNVDKDGDKVPNAIDKDNDGKDNSGIDGAEDGNNKPASGYDPTGDNDGDGIHNRYDPDADSDGDGIPDWKDDYPDDPNNGSGGGGGGSGGGGGGGVPSAPLKDTDGDGIPDILDDDDDNDGLLDFEDPDPLTPNVVDLGSDICDRFDDLEHGAWYEEYIQYVVENGLMEGISDALFDPNGTTSRAQIVMMLWRMEGEPLVTHPLYFADVSEGAWYADALRWTNSEGIVLGYDDGRFGTGDPVTREQIATILWRYTRFKGIDTSSGESTSLLKFSDAKKISAYAISALQWACGEELIRGTVIDDGSIVLDPQGSATRAQVAAILMRFCENIL
ncbi:MAG: InlB B-repeat-containing protein [Oscillospiraceae bacterium]|nr:InlB B-repeat-containing protein [Oscillospiraceae bacterium]